jgi:hypothetical protein
MKTNKTIHKTLLLKIYEPNKAKRKYLDNIINAKTFNEVVLEIFILKQ